MLKGRDKVNLLRFYLQTDAASQTLFWKGKLPPTRVNNLHKHLVLLNFRNE